MMLGVQNALRGSVRIEVHGTATERFLNLCALRGVAFWNVRREGERLLSCSVSVAGYFTVCSAARDGGCCVRVTKRRGLPFLAQRLTRRPALLLCAALCAAAVWWLTGFVWTIGLSGCGQVSEQAMLALLRQEGLYTGARRAAVDAVALRDGLLLRDGRLAFVTINLTGCHAEVTVFERAETPAPVSDEPCNIVSDKAGVIARLRVTAGRAAVEVGQTVLPGDLLATGAMESALGARWEVAAQAEADLRTWHTLRCALTTHMQARAYTGRAYMRRYLVLGTRRFPLEIVEKETFAWYDKQIEERALVLREDFRFRIALVTETVREYLPEEGAADRAALASLLEQRMGAALARVLEGGEVLSLRFSFDDAGPYTGTLEAACLETAGVPVPLVP